MYPFAAVTVVTGVAARTGAVTPPIAATDITVTGTTGVAVTELEATLSPAVLTAFNVMVYEIPLVNPGITTGVVVSLGLNAV